MSNSICKSSVLRLYKEVIDDVISGVREIFLEEGVDEQVLQELKSTWESKLKASKAVQSESEVAAAAAAAAASQQNSKSKQNDNHNTDGNNTSTTSGGGTTTNMTSSSSSSATPTATTAATNGTLPKTVTTPVAHLMETKMVPVQITLPPQPGTEAPPRILTIHVPSSALQGNQLQKALTAQVITATMGLPVPIASSVLQQHVNAVFNSQPQQQITVVNKNVIHQQDGMHAPSFAPDDDEIEIEFVMPAIAVVGKNASDNSRGNQNSSHNHHNHHRHQHQLHHQTKGKKNKREEEYPVEDASTNNANSGASCSRNVVETETNKRKKLKKSSVAGCSKGRGADLCQLDGPRDTSDDDDEASEDENDDDDLDDEKDEEDQEMEDEIGEEEPLNSEDDVTDDDPTDLFDTDNIVVCQYDKIIRNRNKWKFYLKDGIMNLTGQDYVFQKANGDAEW